MTLEIGKVYKCKNNRLVGDCKVKIICDLDISLNGYSRSVVFNNYRYLGVVICENLAIGAHYFYADGKCFTTSEYDLCKPLTEFGVGEYDVDFPNSYLKHKAVITAISPHESLKYNRIGYVIDNEKRMFSTSWSKTGQNKDNAIFDLIGWED